MTKIGWLTVGALALTPAVAMAQDVPAPAPVQQGLEPALEPFTFVLPASVPEPARIDVPDEPISGTVRLEEVEVLTPPAQSRYQPEGSQDLQDAGKTFDVSCRIADTGNMEDCEASPNDIRDETFVEIAVNNVSQTVIGPVADDGQPTAGRTLIVTAQFHRIENLPEDVMPGDLAAVDTGGR